MAVVPGAASTDTGASPFASGLFAHQGGWDEFLLVAAPLGVIGVLLWVANKRVSAKLEEATADDAGKIDGS